jgi:tetratricopeptide (TPR) repeat protein
MALLDKVRGDNTRAREIVERAIARAKQVGALDETASMYALLSSLLRRERRHKESWQTSLMALRASRAIKPDDPRRRENASRALLGLATALHQRKRLIAAERTYLQSARLADKAGDVDLLGRALNGVAACRGAQGQLTRARATFLQSLRAKEKAGDLHQIAIAYTNVAELEIEMKELPAALSHARRAVHTAEQIHAESDLAEMYRVVAEAELALGKVDEAINAGLRALGIAKNVGKHYLDEVVLTLARACVRAAERAKTGSALRGLAEQGRDELRKMLTQGTMDGELKERVELSLALMGEFLS